MKRFLAALALALVVMFAAASCNDANNTFQPNTGAVLSFLSPATASAGGSGFTLTVNGGGFVKQTVVQWNGQNRPTTFVDSTVATAAISAADVAAAGRVFVNTLNPSTKATDNGLSNSIAFLINPAGNPLPTISSMSPTTRLPATGSFTLTIAGTNFLPVSSTTTGSVVQWNAGAQQTNLTPSSITSTQIQVTIPASLTATAGTAIVTVFNPPPGGGTSPGGLTFTLGPVAPRSAGGGQVATGTGGAAVSVASPVAVSEETPALSANGRYVAYAATSGSFTQIFLRATCEGAPTGCQPVTTLLSVAADGTPANDDSHSPSLSADGRYVAFSSAATNLLPGVPSGRQVYLRDTCLGAAASCTPSTQLISTDPGGVLLGAESILPAVSSTGRFVAFLAVTPSNASAPAAAASGATGTNSGYRQVFIRDTCLGAANCTPTTTRISLQPGDAPIAGGVPPGPALSGSGRFAALSDGAMMTLFTRAVAVGDGVFLAATQDSR